MNKQTAQEQMLVMQVEMDKLKAIIDMPEVKTGRVLSTKELKLNTKYWYVYSNVSPTFFMLDKFDIIRINAGLAFHDEKTANKYLEYVKLEQELRRAQKLDKGNSETRYSILISSEGVLHESVAGNYYYYKVNFNTELARDKFRESHTNEQLTLLIKGV